MRKFLVHIGAFAFAALVLLWVLDLAYTTVYKTSTPRTKFQLLRSVAGKEFDYLFLGSSRVDNFIIPRQIERQTGRSSINLGFQSSRPVDIYHMQRILSAYEIRAPKTFVQLDYYYNSTDRSRMMEFEMMPFIRENDAVRNNYAYRDDFKMLYYAPFLRYCLFDHKIGFREIVQNMLGRKTSLAKNMGYNPLTRTMAHVNESCPLVIVDHQPMIDSIRTEAVRQNSELTFFASPLHPDVRNRNFVKALSKKVGGLSDYTDFLTDPTDFANATHVNDKGARKLTSHFIETGFKK